MKYCKDCKYFNQREYSIQSKFYIPTCLHTQSEIPPRNLVFGTIKYNSCAEMRLWAKCGVDAKLFEEKSNWLKETMYSMMNFFRWLV